ncbi:MAG TPA: hypothetical protein VFT91_11725 [Dehalococcoidia bacterium]|nr:hypothetical protein [Dehalococcoidia bacterium]
MIDRRIELVAPYLRADREAEVQRARTVAAATAGRPGVRARSAVILARLALALHPDAAAGAGLLADAAARR